MDWSVGILKIKGRRFPNRLLKLRSLKFIENVIIKAMKKMQLDKIYMDHVHGYNFEGTFDILNYIYGKLSD